LEHKHNLIRNNDLGKSGLHQGGWCAEINWATPKINLIGWNDDMLGYQSLQSALAWMEPQEGMLCDLFKILESNPDIDQAAASSKPSY
jgi:hypothetical protein